MTRYSTEFLAALRQRYEETNQPMRPLALEFGIGISTLSALVERHGWVKRSHRKRGRPEASLISEAQALMASLPARAGATMTNELPALERSPTPSPSVALAGGGRPLTVGAALGENLTAAERIEALLLNEIAAEEAAREALGNEPRLRTEADACARRLAMMTQTLQTLQKIRAVQPMANTRCQCAEYDDLPEDMDAFREQLARRIEAFMESRDDEEFELDPPAADDGHQASGA